MKYFEIVENNEHEGETWSFFVPYDFEEGVNHESVFDLLESLLEETEGRFAVGEFPVSDEQLEFLLRRNAYETTAYYNRYKVVECEPITHIKIFNFVRENKGSDITEDWYKGNIHFEI